MIVAQLTNGHDSTILNGFMTTFKSISQVISREEMTDLNLFVAPRLLRYNIIYKIKC